MYTLLKNIKELIERERYDEAYIENLKFKVADKRDLITLDAVAYSTVSLYHVKRACENAILYGRDSLVYNYFMPDMAYYCGCQEFPTEEGNMAIECKNYKLVHDFADWSHSEPGYEYFAEAAVKHGYFSETANEEEKKIADLIVKRLLRKEPYFIDHIIEACRNDKKLKDYFSLIKKCTELSQEVTKKRN